MVGDPNLHPIQATQVVDPPTEGLTASLGQLVPGLSPDRGVTLATDIWCWILGRIRALPCQVTFDVPFAPLVRCTACHRSSRLELVPADEVSPDLLFALDTELRQDVPGNDGWRGNRLWFDDELASDEFDPAAYLVTRARDSGDLIGLCRLWNNPTGPALGLLGVRRGHRTGGPALTLVHRAAMAASQWGGRHLLDQHRSPLAPPSDGDAGRPRDGPVQPASTRLTRARRQAPTRPELRLGDSL